MSGGFGVFQGWVLLGSLGGHFGVFMGWVWGLWGSFWGLHGVGLGSLGVILGSSWGGFGVFACPPPSPHTSVPHSRGSVVVSYRVLLRTPPGPPQIRDLLGVSASAIRPHNCSNTTGGRPPTPLIWGPPPHIWGSPTPLVWGLPPHWIGVLHRIDLGTPTPYLGVSHPID